VRLVKGEVATEARPAVCFTAFFSSILHAMFIAITSRDSR